MAWTFDKSLFVLNSLTPMDQKFVQRKVDHIQHALSAESQSTLLSQFEQIDLIHDSLPEINFSDVSIASDFLDQEIETPFFVSGMTAGHENAETINHRIAAMCSVRGWVMGIGSQRRELSLEYQDTAVQKLSATFPKLRIISNLGIAQLIELYQQNNFSPLMKLIENTRSVAIAIHLNPLQEAIQPEGTPNMRGGVEAIAAFQKISKVPVIVKETGSGMSHITLRKLQPLNLFAIDVSGTGGTHWGRIEGLRAPAESSTAQLGRTFKNWGISTVESLVESLAESVNNVEPKSKTEIWASGGIRTGLDAAKAIALGAKRVGFAQPVLEAAMKSEADLVEWATRIELELKVAMFCTGSENLVQLTHDKVKGF